MGMMHHHQNHGSMGLVGLIVAMIGLVLFAALIYEIMMNRTWIVQHIPPEVKQAMPESVTKALE
jgi:hypothetical protein